MNGAQYILQNTCGQYFTVEVTSNNFMNFTIGDFHDTAYDNLVQVVPLLRFMPTNYNATEGFQACAYELNVYPTQQMRDDFKSPTVGAVTGVIIAAFVVVLMLFHYRDRYYRAKNRQIIKSVEKSNAIIASLFPSNVRDRLFGDNSGNEDKSQGSRGSRSKRSFGFRLRTYLTEGDAAGDGADNPIADLFPGTS